MPFCPLFNKKDLCYNDFLKKKGMAFPFGPSRVHRQTAAGQKYQNLHSMPSAANKINRLCICPAC